MDQIEVPQSQYICLLTDHNSLISIEGVPFSRFTALKHLDLSDNFIAAARSLRKELGSLKQLKQLNLEMNEFVELNWLSECFLHRL